MKKNNADSNKYLSYCISVGMGLGLLISVIFFNSKGNSIAMRTSFGSLFGVAIGAILDRLDKFDEKTGKK